MEKTYIEKNHTRSKYAGNFKYIQYKEENGCWNCISHPKHKFGYAMIYRGKKMTTVPRYIFEDFYGKSLSRYEHVRHKCDNPSCINPEHLEIGSHKDNMEDKVERNRSGKGKTIGELHHNAVLTVEKVKEIKRLLAERKWSYAHIGSKFGVSDKSIRNIDIGKTWREVDI